MSNYTINIIDSKTDRFESITTNGNTFGDIISNLEELGFEIDFQKRSYVIAETSNELIGDDSQLGFSENLKELTLCVYPKDTKAGLEKNEISNMTFSELRKHVSILKSSDRRGWELHLAHLGGNPTTIGLKNGLINYYNSYASYNTNTNNSKQIKVSEDTTLNQRLDNLEKRVSVLESGVAHVIRIQPSREELKKAAIEKAINLKKNSLKNL